MAIGRVTPAVPFGPTATVPHCIIIPFGNFVYPKLDLLDAPQANSVVANWVVLVPLAAVTPVVVAAAVGNPVQLLRSPLAGLPNAGVTNTGLVLRTVAPVPVKETSAGAVVTPVPPLATDKTPVMLDVGISLVLVSTVPLVAGRVNVVSPAEYGACNVTEPEISPAITILDILCSY
jgi:hypothetical protein